MRGWHLIERMWYMHLGLECFVLDTILFSITCNTWVPNHNPYTQVVHARPWLVRKHLGLTIATQDDNLPRFKLCFHLYVCTCTYTYLYHIKTGLKIWSVSIHDYVYPWSVWIDTMSDLNGWRIHHLGCGRVQPLMWISNKTYYTYTTQL